MYTNEEYLNKLNFCLPFVSGSILIMIFLLQKLFVIFLFSQHHVEQVVNLIGWVDMSFPDLVL